MAIPVLVVESNIDQAQQVKKILEANQLCQVTIATKALEALMRFTETKYKVAIIDYKLPDLDGAGLIRQMRGIDDTIIVAVILDKSDPPSSNIKQLGINAFLDRTTYLADLPKKLTQILKPSSQAPAAPKATSSPTTSQAQVIKEEVRQKIDRGKVDQPVSVPKEVARPESTPKRPQEKIVQKQADQAMRHVEEAPTPKETVEKKFQPKEVKKGTPPERIAVGKATPSEPAKQLKVKDELIQKETLHEAAPSEVDQQIPFPTDEHPPIEQTMDKSATIPPWLKEPDQVEKYLEYLQQDHSAYATLLSIGNTPWTYSEQLTEEQAHGIVRILSEHDEGLQSKGALIRYIRLGGVGSDYLLYATPVIGDINLSMIYNMNTPFNVARRQTHKLSRLLKEQDPRKLVIKEEKPIIEKLISVSQEEDKPLLPSDWIPAPDVKEEVKEPFAASVSPSTDIKVKAEQPVTVSTSPPPDIKVEAEETVTISATPPPREEPGRESVKEPAAATAPEISSFPNDWLPKQPRPAAHLPFLDQITTPSKTMREMEPINLIAQEPRYYLPFTAILLPRFPNHRLAGSLANQLENWLKELCIAWGWRVDNIEIRSEFLRFTFSLSPDIAPAQAVQNLANNLSSRILKAFPGLTKDLPAGQFWTKSYLLTAGSDVGKDRLASFIEITRQEQGLS